jgi:hypothetical protein
LNIYGKQICYVQKGVTAAGEREIFLKASKHLFYAICLILFTCDIAVSQSHCFETVLLKWAF